jgi:hypothetical protein
VGDLYSITSSYKLPPLTLNSVPQFCLLRSYKNAFCVRSPPLPIYLNSLCSSRSFRSLSPSSTLSRTTSESRRTAGSVKFGGSFDELLREEVFWRDCYLWLKECGYRLRPRYQPNWEPSWHATGKSWTKCEDGVTHRVRCLALRAVIFFCSRLISRLKL